VIFSRINQFIQRTVGRPTKTRLRKQIISRDQHSVSRADISDNALKVLYRLNKAGYEAYLVGGGVRDILLGLHPKDFDVATDAKPEDVQKVFRNCRLIGRRFRLAHVLFGQDVVEVATFRAVNDDAPQTEHGMVLRDNVYGTIEDDAIRRDFTVNALYYNIADFSVVDFVGGLKDLQKKTLRLIGDPETRYREDPVRMLRAARLAAKLQFKIEPKTREPILQHGKLLENVSNARLWDECAKLFLTGHGEASFEQLESLQLFKVLFPAPATQMHKHPHARELFRAALASTDHRIAEDKGVNPAFLFAVMLWPCVAYEYDKRIKRNVPAAPALQDAATDVLDRQHAVTAIAKRFSLVMREMWLLQHRFAQRTPSRAEKLLSLPRFRAAFDLLSLRAQAGEPLQELVDWWQQYQDADGEARLALLRQVDKPESKTSNERKRKPRRRSPRKPTAKSE
jgi:poly(A) polymerase